MAERSKPLSPEKRAEQSRWMERIKAGGADGEAALAQVFAAYEKRTVRRLQARFSLDTSEAEDCWQDAVIDLWKSAARFTSGRDLAPWLTTLVNNRALGLLDNAWRRRRVPLRADSGGPTGEDSSDDAPTDSPAQPEAEAEAEADDDHDDSIDSAPAAAQSEATLSAADICTDAGLAAFEKQYPVEGRWLIARDIEGRDVPAIAAEMRCSVVAARQRLRTLRLRLRPFVKHCLDLLPGC